MCGVCESSSVHRKKDLHHHTEPRQWTSEQQQKQYSCVAMLREFYYWGLHSMHHICQLNWRHWQIEMSLSLSLYSFTCCCFGLINDGEASGLRMTHTYAERICFLFSDLFIYLSFEWWDNFILLSNFIRMMALCFSESRQVWALRILKYRRYCRIVSRYDNNRWWHRWCLIKVPYWHHWLIWVDMAKAIGTKDIYINAQ